MADTPYSAPVHGSALGAQVVAQLDPTSPDRPQQFCLIVAVTIDPGLHVYGRPVPAGFIPLAIDVAPVDGVVLGVPAFPPPVAHRIEGLEEEFFIYEGTVSVVMPVTVSRANLHAALDVQVRYQACGEMGCFMPQTVALQLSVPA